MRIASMLLAVALCLFMMPTTLAEGAETEPSAGEPGDEAEPAPEGSQQTNAAASECSFPFGEDQGIWICLMGQKSYVACAIISNCPDPDGN